MKKATGFFCSECGYESAKWAGQCPACKAWNTMVEEPTGKIRSARGAAVSGGGLRNTPQPVSLDEIPLGEEERFSTGSAELDRVLGGGTVAGSMVLVGGDPGIGKSTILLQVCRNFAASGKKVLYVSGEESLKQIKMRAARVGSLSQQLKFLCETNLDTIREVISRNIDSLDRCDGAFLGGCDPLLKRTHFGGKSRLVSYGGRHSSEKSRYL